MKIYNHIIDENLEKFMSTAPRYRLVVVPWDGDLDEHQAVDVGREMASVIEKLDRSDTLGFDFAVEGAFRSLCRKSTFQDEKFGPIVCLKNIGILFEPELGLNVCELLKWISKNTLTIVLWRGEISWDRLSFMTPESNIFINQSDINYFVL